MLVPISVNADDNISTMSSYDTIDATQEWTDHYYVMPSDADETTFYITTPATGYIVLDMMDAGDLGCAVQFKTDGFKDYEYLSSVDAESNVGLSKGTHAFKIKTYSDSFYVRVKFVKISESKFGSRKKKATKISKGSTKKGVIMSDNKKVHWYKIKNPKLQKVKLKLKLKANGGGKYGGVKVTAYQNGKNMGSTKVSAYYNGTDISLYTIGKGDKLTKGTYYIKVQSYDSGNGYFSLKWK